VLLGNVSASNKSCQLAVHVSLNVLRSEEKVKDEICAIAEVATAFCRKNPKNQGATNSGVDR